MAPLRAFDVFLPFVRAVGQLDDPAFLGVVVRSIAWSAACFAVLITGCIWAVHHWLSLHGWVAWGWLWGGDLLGTIAAFLLAFWLFLPVAAAIGTCYFERIAIAVERRFYPWLPPPNHASALEQAWDGIAVALQVLALNIVALLLAIFIPGAGLVLGWMIGAYAIGRGLFVAVAMRRMPRSAAEALYRHVRGAVLTQGAILAATAYIPFANLLIPIIGTAAMVHILDLSLGSAPISATQRIRL
jgi:CysZ protein